MICISIKNKYYRENHINYINSFENFAICLRNLGEYKDAKDIFQKCLDIKKDLYTKKHLYYANTLFNLSILQSLLKEPVKAKNLLTKCL